MTFQFVVGVELTILWFVALSKVCNWLTYVHSYISNTICTALQPLYIMHQLDCCIHTSYDVQVSLEGSIHVHKHVSMYHISVCNLWLSWGWPKEIGDACLLTVTDRFSLIRTVHTLFLRQLCLLVDPFLFLKLSMLNFLNISWIQGQNYA